MLEALEIDYVTFSNYFLDGRMYLIYFFLYFGKEFSNYDNQKQSLAHWKLELKDLGGC
jgi:hypothetical protein